MSEKTLESISHALFNDMVLTRTRLEERIAQLESHNAALVEALEMVLLYHSGSPWDAAKSKRWERWTGSDDATTRNLCAQVRAVLSRAPSAPGEALGGQP